MNRTNSYHLEPSFLGRAVRTGVVIYAGTVLIVLPIMFGGTLDMIRNIHNRKKARNKCTSKT